MFMLDQGGLTAVSPVQCYQNKANFDTIGSCLLYTSDAADEEDSVDLGGRRIIKKVNKARISKFCTMIRP